MGLSSEEAVIIGLGWHLEEYCKLETIDSLKLTIIDFFTFMWPFEKRRHLKIQIAVHKLGINI